MIEIPLALDAFGGSVAGASLLATILAAAVAFYEARKKGRATDTASLIEVNEYLRRENIALRAEVVERDEIIDTQRSKISSLQEKADDLHAKIEELQDELQRIATEAGGS